MLFLFCAHVLIVTTVRAPLAPAHPHTHTRLDQPLGTPLIARATAHAPSTRVCHLQHATWWPAPVLLARLHASSGLWGCGCTARPPGQSAWHERVPALTISHFLAPHAWNDTHRPRCMRVTGFRVPRVTGVRHACQQHFIHHQHNPQR